MSNWTLGVDVAVAQLDVVLLSSQAEYLHQSIPLERDEIHGKQLLGILTTTTPRLAFLASPWLAYVELPVGKFAKPRLVMTAGIACAAVEQTYRTPSYLIPPPKWKKNIGLKGNAPKSDILAWAHARGLPIERSQDCADALGLATSAAIDLGWVGASTLPLKEWQP